MKKNLALVAALMLSVGVSAQKDEMKVLKKIYDKDAPSEKDLAEYKSAVAKLDAYPSLEEGDRVYANFYKGMTPMVEMGAEMARATDPAKAQAIGMKYLNLKNLKGAAEVMPAVIDYEKKTGKKLYTADIEETAKFLTPYIVPYAESLAQQNNYKDAATVLYSVYQMDRNQPDYLYYAANYAINAQDYDSALKYYGMLRDLKYTGERTVYLAKNRATDTYDRYLTKAERDKMVTLKTHEAPKEEKEPSKRGEIYKNIALILINQGKDDEAKAAVAEAKKANPNDTDILLVEADMYYRLKDMESYKRAISEALAKNPNDADLLYNLGVVSMQTENIADAEMYFNKAIAADPNYINAYVNLSSLKLRGEKPLVEEMNKLGTSAADNKKYDVLKKKRDDLLREALVPLEKAYEVEKAKKVSPKDSAVIDNLISLYGYFEMKDKAKALKALRDQ